jgi:hypothetical protein
MIGFTKSGLSGSNLNQLALMVKGNALRLVPSIAMEEHEMGNEEFLKPVTGPQQIDRKVIYGSLLVVVVLAILYHFTAGQIYSLATIVLIVFIVLGNIGYLYSRRKRPSAHS